MTYVQHPAFPDDKPFEVTNADEWVEQGWVVLAEKAAAEVDPDITPHPAGNATRDEWAAYALSQGATDDELEGLGRDDIRDLYPQQ